MDLSLHLHKYTYCLHVLSDLFSVVLINLALLNHHSQSLVLTCTSAKRCHFVHCKTT